MRKCQLCGGKSASHTKFCNHCGKILQPVKNEIGKVKESAFDRTNEKNKHVQKDLMGESGEVPGDQKESNKVIETPSDIRTTETQTENIEHPKLNHKKKMIFFSHVTVALLFIGAYVLGDYLTSVNHLLNEFETAVGEKDTKKLADLLIMEHKDLELTADSLDNFIKLFESQPKELADLMNHLKDGEYGEHSTKEFPVDLIKDGKKFLLFDHYHLTVNPVYVKVSTNYKDTDIIVNGDILATTDTDDFNENVGPLTPGEYTIEAVYDTGFYHLTNEKYVRLTNPGHSQNAKLYLEGSDVHFDVISNRYDELEFIKLYIDDKDTGLNLTENEQVGPLLTDGSLKASFEADLPWGTMRTNDIPINDAHLDFNLGNSEEFQETIKDVVILFNEQFVEAFTSADITKLTTTTPNFVEALLDEIAYNVFRGVEYEGSFHGLDFYEDSFELTKNDEGHWKVIVDTVAHFEEAFYDRGENIAPDQSEEELRYELIYDPKKEEWIIANIDSPDSMEEDKMDRHKVSEPVVYSSDWAALEEEDLYAQMD